MKARLLIIIGIVLASIGLGSFAYVVSVQSQCESLLGDTHYPRPLTLWNCLDYLKMIQENPEPEVIDSLKIPNTERDAMLAAGYKLYPGVGWVSLNEQRNAPEPIYRDNPNNPGELILDLDAMIKEYDLERSPPPEQPFEKEEPFTKIEIMFGEKLDDKLVPVTITEVTTNAETLDEIIVWNFELIDHSGDDRRIVWDTLPKDKRIWYKITDDDGQDIRIAENIYIPLDQHIYKMNCGFFQTVESESAHPTLLKIKNNTSTIYAQNSRIGIYPDSNGEYSFEFASIFGNYVLFPEDAVEIISQETRECTLTQNIEDDPKEKYANGYYTKMTFRFN